MTISATFDLNLVHLKKWLCVKELTYFFFWLLCINYIPVNILMCVWARIIEIYNGRVSGHVRSRVKKLKLIVSCPYVNRNNTIHMNVWRSVISKSSKSRPRHSEMPFVSVPIFENDCRNAAFLDGLFVWKASGGKWDYLTGFPWPRFIKGKEKIPMLGGF